MCKSEIVYLEARYASQVLNEIPLNKWIDKSVGGCGLSHLCLTDQNDSIILMPRVKLIENKVQQKDKYSNLFVVNSGVGKKEVFEYIQKMESKKLPIKILTTYNSFSLGKLDYLIEEKKDCRIYVDESQFLISFAEHKMELINELHTRLKKEIHRVSFFSAHPPKREYLPNYIQEMNSVKYVWANQTKATPYIIDTDKPYFILNKILDSLLKNGTYEVSDLSFKKVIIFLNSIEGIRKIIEPLNSKENIAYIVGDSLRNDTRLNDFANPLIDCRKLPIITIGTTTMISGIDLYDSETLNIVVSTSSKDFTLFDKELDVPQAITRQRLDTNPNNNKFIFLIDKRNMDKKTKSIEEIYNNSVNKLKDVVWNINWVKTGGGNCDAGFELYRGFYYLENDAYVMNESLLLAKKYLFEQLYKQYQEGYNIVSTEKPKEVFIDIKDFHNKTFREYANEILSLGDLSSRFEVLNSIYNTEWKTYLSYGIEKNKVYTNLFEAKKFYETKDTYKSTVLLIRKSFKVGEFYPCDFIKSELQKIYSKKNTNKTAKATDLHEFFELESVTKKIKGIAKMGFTIKNVK